VKRRAFLSTSLLAGMTPRVLAENEPLTPESPGYDKARQLFNSDLSLRPAFILPCRNERQVAEAIGFANEKDLPVAVKSGGHSFAGF
jgi:FAD/FMN-containing dehydrogenase